MEVFEFNFTSFEYFAVLAKSNSFREASGTLNISQQALSAQINKLERELQVSLITNQRPAALTICGQYIAEYAQTMLHMRAHLQQTLLDLAGQTKTLYISIPSSGAPPFLTDAVLRFSTTESNCQIRLEERPENAAMLDLSRFSFYLSTQKFHPDLEYLKIQSYNSRQLDNSQNFTHSNVISIVVREDLLHQCWGAQYETNLKLLEENYNLSPLRSVPFIRAESVEEVISQYLSEKGLIPKVVMVASNPETCFRMCLSGLGAEIVPDGWGLKQLEHHKERDDMRLIRLDPIYPSTDYYLGYLTRKELTPQEEAFIRCICSACSQLEPKSKN